MNKEIFLCVKCREKLKESGEKVSLVRHCRDKKETCDRCQRRRYGSYYVMRIK